MKKWIADMVGGDWHDSHQKESTRRSEVALAVDAARDLLLNIAEQLDPVTLRR